MVQVRKTSTTPQKANTKGFIYLLAGVLKGKKLEVITAPGLRPIGSRVKEIFFNWVQFDILGREVLDLFAGSGALGFEALSRGCKSLQMYEYNKAVYDQLLANYKSLNQQQLELNYGRKPEVSIVIENSYKRIKQPATKQYDLVFVDPPFMQEQELTVLVDLVQQGYLADQALVFLQLDSAYQGLMNLLDPRFTIKKFKKVGNILLYLLEFHVHTTVSK